MLFVHNVVQYIFFKIIYHTYSHLTKHERTAYHFFCYTPDIFTIIDQGWLQLSDKNNYLHLFFDLIQFFNCDLYCFATMVAMSQVLPLLVLK